MHPLKRLGITYMACGLLLAILMSLALAYASGLFNSAANANAKEISKNWAPSVYAISEIKFALNDLRRLEAQAIIDERNCVKESCAADATQARQSVLDKEKIYQPLISSEDEDHQYQTYQILKLNYYMMQDALLHTTASELRTKRFSANSDVLFKDVLGALDKLIDLNKRSGLKAYSAADQNFYLANATKNWLLLLLASQVFFLLVWIVKTIKDKETT